MQSLATHPGARRAAAGASAAAARCTHSPCPGGCASGQRGPRRHPRQHSARAELARLQPSASPVPAWVAARTAARRTGLVALALEVAPGPRVYRHAPAGLAQHLTIWCMHAWRASNAPAGCWLLTAVTSPLTPALERACFKHGCSKLPQACWPHVKGRAADCLGRRALGYSRRAQVL